MEETGPENEDNFYHAIDAPGGSTLICIYESTLEKIQNTLEVRLKVNTGRNLQQLF